MVLELIARWRVEDTMFLIKKEEDVKTLKVVENIHKVLNHKLKEQMLFAYKNDGKLNRETRKLIEKVTEEY